MPTDIVACEIRFEQLREWPGLDSDIELPETRNWTVEIRGDCHGRGWN